MTLKEKKLTEDLIEDIKSKKIKMKQKEIKNYLSSLVIIELIYLIMMKS